ncbi:MAG: DUF3006 domain-containing protein [Ruminococcus sp.]|nr:DUF3006 domain-containing protein [Ruminococcus sp.]
MMLSIDRFEGKYAVCVDESQRIVKIKRRRIKGEAHEGDIIKRAVFFYYVMKKETQSIKDEISKLQDELFE